MKRIFLHYLYFIIIFICVLGNITVSWGFVSEGNGTRYNLETLDAATEEIERTTDGSYLIHSSITIANLEVPDVLTITPGALLKFARGAELRIKGRLISIGNKNKPIKFTSQNFEKWNGIVFDGTRSENSIIKYSLIENAQNGILVDSANVRIIQNEIRQIASAAISFWNLSEGNIVGNTISESDIGIYCKESSPKIEENKISGLNFGIWMKSAFPPTIKGNSISKSRSAAIILTHASKSHIESNQLIDNHHGISCNDSDPTIEGNSITGGEYGIRLENDSYPVVAGNTISDSSKAGIAIFQSCASIKNNTITFNSTVSGVRYGIYCEESSPRIEANAILNTPAGIVARLMSNPIIKNNTIDNTIQPVIDVDNGPEQLAIDGPVKEIDTTNKVEPEFTAKLQPTLLSSQISSSEMPSTDFPAIPADDDEHTKTDNVPAEEDEIVLISDHNEVPLGKPPIEKQLQTVPAETKPKSPANRVPKRKISQLEKKIENPKTPPNKRIAVQFELGRLYFKAGDYQKALAYYDAIVEEFVGKKKRKKVKQQLANVHYHRGLTYYQLEQYANAVDACKLSMKLNPTSEVQLRIQYILAMSYVNMTDSTKQIAKRAFEKVLKFKPKDEEEEEIVAYANFQLGLMAMQSKDYGNAIPQYQKAVEHLQKSQKQDNTAKIVKAVADVAYCYLQLKDYQQAQSWYERLISTAPEDDNNSLATAYLALGDIYTRDKKLAEAEKNYSAAVQHADAAGWSDELRGDIYFKFGETLLSSEKRAPAQNAYQKAVKLNPNARWKADATYNIGEICFAKEDYENAIVAYQQAIDGYESELDELTDEELIDRARTRLALSKFQLAEAYNSHNERNYQKVSNAYQEARRASMSLSDEALRHAIKKDALYGEAIFLQKLGRQEESIAAASNLAEVAAIKNDTVGLLQAGDLLFESANSDGNYHKVAEVYEQTLKIWQESKNSVGDERFRLMTRLAFCYLKMSENTLSEDRDELLRKSVANYDAVLSEPEESILEELLNNSRYHKAIAHKLLGEYDEAAGLFEAVIAASEPSSGLDKVSLLPLAEIYESEQKYDNAIRTYETAYNNLMEPQNQALVLHKLGELSRQDGRYEDAIRYYQELVIQYPQSEFAPPAQYFIGLSYSNKSDAQVQHTDGGGEYDLHKACEAYEKFIENYPSSELALDAHWNLASLYDRLGQKTKAMDICKKIIETYQSLGNVNIPKSESQIPMIVDAAQNMLSNILLDKMDADEVNATDTEMLTTQLEQIINSQTQTSDAKANAHFELGNIHFRAKDYQSALVEYDGAISESPADELLIRIYYHKTLVYYELKEYSNLITTSQKLLELSLNTEIKAHLMYLLGVSYQALGQQADAEESFKTAIQLMQVENPPEDGDTDFGSGESLSRPEIAARAHLYLGNLFSQQERLSEAEEEYQQAAWSDIPVIQAEAYHQMARLYEQQKSDSSDDEKIIQMYSNVLDVSTNNFLTADALYKRGLLYAQMSQDEAAAADFEELIEQFSRSQDNAIKAVVEDATFRLSKIYGKQGNIDAAIEKAKSTESIAKQQGDLAILAQAQYQLALLYYKKAQDYEPKNKTYKQLATQASQLYQSASENANSVSDADEKLQEIINVASFQAGQLAYQTGNFNNAIAVLTSFIEQFPSDAKIRAAWNYLAWSYYQSAGKQRANQKRKQLFLQAADSFEKLSQEFNDDDRIAEWLYQAGQASAEAGEYNRAVTNYRRLADIYPTHKLADVALYSMANALRATEQYNDAIKTYQELLSKYPKSDWADASAYSIGNCYEKMKRFDESIVAYQSVMEKFNDSPLAANAQANIAHYYFNRKDYVHALDEYGRLTKANFPNIDAKLLKNVKSWIKDIENVLSESIYRQAIAAVSKAEDDKISQEQRKKYAQDALLFFKQITEKYPNSIYVDNVTVSMGAAHEILEQWEEAIASYKIIVERYPETPPTKEIATLIAYAQERIKAVEMYIWQKEKFE